MNNYVFKHNGKKVLKTQKNPTKILKNYLLVLPTLERTKTRQKYRYRTVPETINTEKLHCGAGTCQIRYRIF